MGKSGFVAIIGRPNAGKSTLLNSILGVKVSIVTPKAQTTREKVLGILTEKQGQIVFMDTPGIHRAREGGINASMMQEARDALDQPSAVWYLVDPRSKLHHEEIVLDLLKDARAPVFVLFNKVDMRDGVTSKESLDEAEAAIRARMSELKIPVQSVLRVSALKGIGIKPLLAETWKLMPEGPLYYPDEEQLSDRPTRFFVAEKVREQLFLQLGEEIPYSCAVEIEKFDESAKPIRIEAVIHVERDSQKGMVIGKGATKIKSIGQSARMQIEKFLGEKVFLGLQVKVLKDWTRDADTLRRMGYNLPK